jgi:hypothetical protein
MEETAATGSREGSPCAIAVVKVEWLEEQWTSEWSQDSRLRLVAVREQMAARNSYLAAE